MAARMNEPIEITFLGHAAVRLRGSRTIFVDPFLTGNPAASMAAESIAVADVIGVTHDHDDHLGDAFAIAARTGATIVAVHELAVEAQSQGLTAIGMNIGGTVEAKGVKIHMVPALHSAGRGCPSGLVFELDGKRIYHAGDTGLTNDLKLVGEFFQPDLAFIPIGDVFTMGPISAAHAVEFTRAKMVVPIHYGTFPLINSDPRLFKSLVGGIAEVHILKPGETLAPWPT
jgi:L-ascorbate metabolism protein UlaG (beta-lactamase superfamily)